MQAIEIVRAAIPDADESLASHILWGRTPFPFTKVTAKDLYRAASSFARAGANGRRLCDWCHREAEKGEWVCASCRAGLDSCRR